MEKRITVSGVLSEAWQCFRANVKYIYYLYLPALALSFIATLTYPKEAFESPTVFLEGAWASHLFALLSLLIGMFATVSLLAFLRSGKKDSWQTWQQYPKLVLKYIGVSILQGLLILAGFILLIIPGIYLALRYAFVGLRTLEHPTESIKDLFAAEARATEGNRWTLLGMFVVIFLGVGVISSLFITFLPALIGPYYGTILTDFIVNVITLPFVTLISIVAYTQLTAKAGPEVESDEAKPEDASEEKIQSAEEEPKEAPLEPKPLTEPVV